MRVLLLTLYYCKLRIVVGLGLHQTAKPLDRNAVGSLGCTEGHRSAHIRISDRLISFVRLLFKIHFEWDFLLGRVSESASQCKSGCVKRLMLILAL